jgi:hypothetical protein
MRVSEAKDFLVQQTAQQAQLEGVPLSNLEKRMMYFTESANATEDPIKLNEEFEAKYDTAEYESKISGLLNRAYARVKKENSAAVGLWDESVRCLRKGDHYILVLVDLESSSEPRPGGSLKSLGTLILSIVIFFALIFGLIALSTHYGVSFKGWNTESRSYASTPLWIQRLIIVVIVGGYISYVILPWVLRKLPARISESFPKFLRISPRPKDRR